MVLDQLLSITLVSQHFELILSPNSNDMNRIQNEVLNFINIVQIATRLAVVVLKDMIDCFSEADTKDLK